MVGMNIYFMDIFFNIPIFKGSMCEANLTEFFRKIWYPVVILGHSSHLFQLGCTPDFLLPFLKAHYPPLKKSLS